MVEEFRRLLTPKDICRIAKEIVRIVDSYDDRTELDRLEGLLEDAQKAKGNHMTSLRACSDDTVREMILEDLSALGAELIELEKQLELEMARRHVVTEEQIEKSLTKLAEGDIFDVAYRRTLIRLLVNKIFLYDDRFTITFNTGDEEVEITVMLLEEIEENLEGENLCLLNQPLHQFEAVSGHTA